jgi:putative ABC transport system ATP-binding protein
VFRRPCGQARTAITARQRLRAQTGQLDLETARQIMRLIRSIAHGEGITAIVATHDSALIELADRVLELKDDRLVD